MDKKEVGALLAMNKANFPYAYKDMTKEEKTALLNSWEMQFRDYPAELINAAFMEAMKVCRNPITIADIFDRLNKIRRATEKPTEELWQDFLKAANKVARLSNGFYYNGPSNKYQYMTQGQERKHDAETIFNELDSRIKTYVGSLKRLIDFGNMDSEHLEQVIFPSFRRSIESMGNRQEVLETTSPAMLEMAAGQGDLDAKLLDIFAAKRLNVMHSNTNYDDAFDR